MIRGIGTSKGIGMGNAVLVDIKDTEFEVINICTVKKDMEPQRMKITVNTDSALWNSLKRS